MSQINNETVIRYVVVVYTSPKGRMGGEDQHNGKCAHLEIDFDLACSTGVLTN